MTVSCKMMRYFGRCLCMNAKQPVHPACREEMPVRALNKLDQGRMHRHNHAFKSVPVTKPKDLAINRQLFFSGV